ncbi:MAG: hypothetical protein HC860_22920 [Alkalinema sp. RU_4_3]|nr:hypothetical protein [Alkalinema sp. RU_4_3]
MLNLRDGQRPTGGHHKSCGFGDQSDKLLVYRQPHPQTDLSPMKPAQWEWDMAGILTQKTTQNVVALMVERIQQLQPNTLTVLQLAACLGNPFNLADLATVYEHTPDQTLEALWSAIAAGLIIPLNEQYRLYLNSSLYAQWGQSDDPELAEQQRTFLLSMAQSARFQFHHDRVQEAPTQKLP